MTREREVEIVDEYAHLTQVLAAAAEPGETITHSEEPPVAIVRAEAEASLWAVVVGDELVTTFRGDAEGFRSTIDLGVWIDQVTDWWTAEEEPQPPGFERGGSAFR
ncbi:hypothetical protein PM038_18125 [Halorubrum ezzemoulense]|uniref:hypothetical protein n=1 Tax=Halorubrum ezzemoulense TaxID=337243 RepID=UPI00232B2170|nr:hypothetical protein [Halorubrum ezzemoulense]MDB2287136.1 hypothetical protein [Halorubrum ezzemoulense]